MNLYTILPEKKDMPLHTSHKLGTTMPATVQIESPRQELDFKALSVVFCAWALGFGGFPIVLALTTAMLGMRWRTHHGSSKLINHCLAAATALLTRRNFAFFCRRHWTAISSGCRRVFLREVWRSTVVRRAGSLDCLSRRVVQTAATRCVGSTWDGFGRRLRLSLFVRGRLRRSSTRR